MRTARVRRETGLMRLLTARVSGGTPRLMFPALAKISSPWCRIFSAALMSALVSWPKLRHLNIAWLIRLPGQRSHTWSTAGWCAGASFVSSDSFLRYR